MNTTARLVRLLALAGSALVCAVLAGLAALHVHGKTLPPSDAAFGISVWRSLADPFVFGLWIRLTLLGAAFGFAFAVFTLWRADLTKAIPLVALVTVVAAATSALAFAPLSPVIGFASGLAAMVWFRFRGRRVA